MGPRRKKAAQLRSGPLNPDPQPRRPLQDLQWLTMPPRMRHIIGRMHYYNQLIACYLAGSIETPHMAIFEDQRNWIQRSLLELPYFDEVVVEPDGPFSRFDHEAVRASLLFYSYLVIFPIPFAYSPYDRLRQLLMGILMDEGAQNLPQPFLLWAVSLGAISEIQILGHLQDSQQCWNDYKSVVQSVMWQDSVLDPFMQRIWLAHILAV
ncbi:hypothetical protein TSTA_002130 [Talaromyces stipitatus ATCC 10500]|uniref:C6 finger domain protein n=1 Tax=Talaromyces stipitatus (strain ATCC 10500 / CBS 375.48 / QM 6759 / NRRL 1006) TaxID=441959 RepID=B8MSZ0_TALSN|nr:uncharacterized protein TSTA_002130 [Talaromyces stipitatus ATCC 10500]EED12146.1 hypothetical protein TSTA_002130 [Talaromyces stipitatus ATCC 10500]